MTLVEFLRARVDDDEAYARNAYGDHNKAVAAWSELWSGAVQVGPDEDLIMTNDSQVTRHIARHDPARVLAEVEAKRRIMDLHERRRQTHTFTRLGAAPVTVDLWTCAVCCDDRCPTWEELGENHRDPSLIGCCGTLPLLAPPYADRPGYDESWRPA